MNKAWWIVLVITIIIILSGSYYLLILNKQGRAENCNPLEGMSWDGTQKFCERTGGEIKGLYCLCPKNKTWSCYGCSVINETICLEGKGKWINNQCQCRSGQWDTGDGKCLAYPDL